MRLANAIHALRFGPEGAASREGALFVAWVLQNHSAEVQKVVLE